MPTLQTVTCALWLRLLNSAFFECGLVQSPTVVLRLSEYQGCAQQLQSLSPDVSALCRVVALNKDLLQHLVSLCALIGQFKQRVSWIHRGSGITTV